MKGPEKWTDRYGCMDVRCDCLDEQLMDEQMPGSVNVSTCIGIMDDY